jgi:MFS family permease
MAAADRRVSPAHTITLAPENTPMNRSYGWVIVAVGALMTCVAAGSVFSLAVLLQPIAETTGWSRTGVSSAMTIVFLSMGFAGFGWGALSDRFGPRAVVFSGSILLALGLLAASRATSLLEFQLAYGIVVGVAAGSFFAPMMAAASNWFETQRSLAVSLVSAGLGVAPMTVSPFVSWLIQTYDWRTTQTIVAIGAVLLLAPASLLVRRAPSAQLAGTPAARAAAAGPTVAAALRSPQFIVLALTYFACCATHSGPIFHTISYAMFCGVAPMAAVTIYSLEGLAGLGGRLLLGVAADRLGVKLVLIAGLVVQALAAGTFVFARELTDFYAISAVFGLAYGGVMPLYAALARGYFGPRIIGTMLGAASVVSCLGMALGPMLGGWIFDTFHAYTGLYLTSLALGLGAVAIAFAFPPLPARAQPQLQPA